MGSSDAETRLGSGGVAAEAEPEGRESSGDGGTPSRMLGQAAGEATWETSRLYEMNEQGFRYVKGGEGVGEPESSRQLWNLEVREGGTSRVLDWSIATGSAREDQPRTLERADQGIVGIQLHHDLHGPTAHELDPPPLIVPRDFVAGAHYSGVSTGRGGEAGSAYTDYDTTYKWRLETVTSESYQLPTGESIPVWRIRRHIEELVDERSGTQPDNEFVVEVEELVDPVTGIPVQVSGRHYVKPNPWLMYDMTFELQLDR